MRSANPTEGDIWSPARRKSANRMATAFTGVIATTTAAVGIRPDTLSAADAALGAILIGIATLATRVSAAVVSKETESGTHLDSSIVGRMVAENLFVLSYPAFSAAWLFIGSAAGLSIQPLLDTIFLTATVVVFLMGFLSSFVLDRGVARGLGRGTYWVAISVGLLIVHWYR